MLILMLLLLFLSLLFNREFVEDVFLVCGDTIENEMDPNSFSPFLGLEKPPPPAESEGRAAVTRVTAAGAVPMPPKPMQQNKRESKAIRQSKRLSSQGMVETTPLLRGGMYESLFFFSQQSFFGKDGLSAKARTSSFSVLSVTPQVLAEQWTLLEHFLFSKVKRSDFLDKEEEKQKEKEGGGGGAAGAGAGGASGSGSNLQQLKQFQWHMMDWCISQIIHSSSIDDARAKISFFLNVATCMESFRNFNGMFEIFTVLHTTSVFRLKEAWKGLSAACLERDVSLKELFHTTDSFANYRSYLLKLPDLRNKPTVPYLGVYLKDLVHLKQLPTRASEPGKESLVNMAKMTSLSSKLLDLHAFQQVAYRFAPDFPVITDMFSRPELRTEEEQYQGSLLLAPVEV
jgi:hypothetical protein